jgi:hypothetical protein
MMNWTLARPDCIPTPARGNEKFLKLKDFKKYLPKNL